MGNWPDSLPALESGLRDYYQTPCYVRLYCSYPFSCWFLLCDIMVDTQCHNDVICTKNCLETLPKLITTYMNINNSRKPKTRWGHTWEELEMEKPGILTIRLATEVISWSHLHGMTINVARMLPDKESFDWLRSRRPISYQHFCKRFGWDSRNVARTIRIRYWKTLHCNSFECKLGPEEWPCMVLWLRQIAIYAWNVANRVTSCNF